MYCKNCGKRIKPNQKFCPFCGAKQDLRDQSFNNRCAPMQPTSNVSDIPQEQLLKIYYILDTSF